MGSDGNRTPAHWDPRKEFVPADPRQSNVLGVRHYRRPGPQRTGTGARGWEEARHRHPSSAMWWASAEGRPETHGDAVARDHAH